MINFGWFTKILTRMFIVLLSYLKKVYVNLVLITEHES